MLIEKYFCRNRIESFMKCEALTCKDIKIPLITKQQTTCHKFWIINLENAFSASREKCKVDENLEGLFRYAKLKCKIKNIKHVYSQNNLVVWFSKC